MAAVLMSRTKACESCILKGIARNRNCEDQEKDVELETERYRHVYMGTQAKEDFSFVT